MGSLRRQIPAMDRVIMFGTLVGVLIVLVVVLVPIGIVASIMWRKESE